MTSLLRKKLRTTVRNNARYWLLSLIAGASFSVTSAATLSAQEHVPVNPFRGQPTSSSSQTPSLRSRPAEFQARQAQPIASEPVGLGNGEVVLRWRASDKVAPSPPGNASSAVASAAASNGSARGRNAERSAESVAGEGTTATRMTPDTAARVGSRSSSATRTTTATAALPRRAGFRTAVAPVSYQEPSAAPQLVPPGATTSPLQDPFGDRSAAPALPNLPPGISPNLQPPTADPLATPEAAPLPTFPPPSLPGESAEEASEPNRFPGSLPPSPMPADIENAPMPIQPPEETSLPKLGTDEVDLQAPEVSASDRDDVLALPPSNAPTGYSCDEIRSRLKQDTIDRIELDVSPRFGRGSKATELTTQLRDEFAAKAPVRTWYDRSGREVARGRLQDWRRNRAILDVDGQEVAIPVSDLSDQDVAYISDAWGVPHLCGLNNDDWKYRQHSPITMTWKSSELMHKPLYFEEVALERYGHSAGPVLQPVVSTGHFFANIAVLPYKMGIHPMSECQYALGYYRPGNCAPWQIPAIPLSGRGALMQAGVMTGMAGLLP